MKTRQVFDQLRRGDTLRALAIAAQDRARVRLVVPPWHPLMEAVRDFKPDDISYSPEGAEKLVPPWDAVHLVLQGQTAPTEHDPNDFTPLGWKSPPGDISLKREVWVVHIKSKGDGDKLVGVFSTSEAGFDALAKAVRDVPVADYHFCHVEKFTLDELIE